MGVHLLVLFTTCTIYVTAASSGPIFVGDLFTTCTIYVTAAGFGCTSVRVLFYTCTIYFTAASSGRTFVSFVTTCTIYVTAASLGVHLLEICSPPVRYTSQLQVSGVCLLCFVHHLYDIRHSSRFRVYVC